MKKIVYFVIFMATVGFSANAQPSKPIISSVLDSAGFDFVDLKVFFDPKTEAPLFARIFTTIPTTGDTVHVQSFLSDTPYLRITVTPLDTQTTYHCVLVVENSLGTDQIGFYISTFNKPTAISPEITSSPPQIFFTNKTLHYSNLSPGMRLEVFGLNGQMVYQENLTEAQKQITMDLGVGMYIARILGKNPTTPIIKKIVLSE